MMTSTTIKDHRGLLALALLLTIVWLKSIYAVSSGATEPDFFWHLRYGQWMLEHGAIPSTDFFSWTHHGAPYLMTQWLGELVIGWSYNQGGFTGTLVMSVTCSALIYLCCWRAASLHVDRLTASILTVMNGTIFILSSARPQIFTFLGTAWTMLLIAGFLADRRKLRSLWWMVPTAALWVNLHGGYIVAIALLGICFVGQLVEHAINKTLRSARLALAEFALIICCTLGATCLNPWGWHAWESLIMISQLQSSRVIVEWQSVSLFTDVGSLYLLAVLPYVGLLIAAKRLPNLPELLLAGFAVLFGALANRQIAICAAIMPCLTASLLRETGFLNRIDQTQPELQRLIRRSRATLVAVTLIATATWWPLQKLALRNVDQTLSARYPVAASEFLIKHGLTSRLVNDPSASSYLIHRNIPVFVDGRMDLYGDEFFFSWYLASKAAPGWDTFLAKWSPNALLLRVDTALRQAALATGEWCQVYEDDYFSVVIPCKAQRARGIPLVPIEKPPLGTAYASRFQP
jgi:hypothetical protein